MAFSSSRQKLIGPVESDYIMNHYKAFTYANPNSAQQQETKVDIDLSVQPACCYTPCVYATVCDGGPLLNVIALITGARKPSKTASDVKSRSKKRTGTTSLYDKKFVPTFHNGELYFLEQDKEQSSSFKGAAKPAPSVTSLNRELSTVSYDYDQLNAILGPYTMRRLIAQSKTTSELKQNAGTAAKELSQDTLNMLRTALETLSHVDAATLRRQYKDVGPMAIQGRDCIPVQPAPAPDEHSDHGEIGNAVATAPPDELALPAGKSDALECEHAKEIQGAAELCIRPSKVAVMKSETELNIKYNAMVTEVVAQRMSKESGGSRESSNPNAGQIRSAAGKAHSVESVSDDGGTEESSTGDIQSVSCSYSYESSSLTTADDPSMLYPTAASCSYSDDYSGSELGYGSLHTASDGWWTENMESSHCVSSVSTGIWLSNCSEPPSSLYSAQSLSSADLVTADLCTGDMETAEAAESDIEAANLVFDMILTAKSESVYPCYTDEINVNTADSSLIEGDAEVEQHPEANISDAPLRPFDEVQNATSEDCITGEEHSESLSSASSTSCGDDRYYSLESDGVEVHEIESQTNLGSTRG